MHRALPVLAPFANELYLLDIVQRVDYLVPNLVEGHHKVPHAGEVLPQNWHPVKLGGQNMLFLPLHLVHDLFLDLCAKECACGLKVPFKKMIEENSPAMRD